MNESIEIAMLMQCHMLLEQINQFTKKFKAGYFYSY